MDLVISDTTRHLFTLAAVLAVVGAYSVGAVLGGLWRRGLGGWLPLPPGREVCRVRGPGGPHGPIA